jgi:hypothetical protein
MKIDISSTAQTQDEAFESLESLLHISIILNIYRSWLFKTNMIPSFAVKGNRPEGLSIFSADVPGFNAGFPLGCWKMSWKDS